MSFFCRHHSHYSGLVFYPIPILQPARDPLYPRPPYRTLFVARSGQRARQLAHSLRQSVSPWSKWLSKHRVELPSKPHTTDYNFIYVFLRWLCSTRCDLSTRGRSTFSTTSTIVCHSQLTRTCMCHPPSRTSWTAPGVVSPHTGSKACSSITTGSDGSCTTPGLSHTLCRTRWLYLRAIRIHRLVPFFHKVLRRSTQAGNHFIALSVK